ncbi:hypothetical protein J2739_004826 [Variovorax soli]|uniref:Uncharacterized protein n=1 Tax=Variovorax soli TaxID=376815 RepID=A0ABU1NKT8_9BURK|nr:hypothetical protein [Variovorax soli]
MILTDDRLFEDISILVRAGLLIATMQVVVEPLGGLPLPGLVVEEVTQLGWLVIRSKTKM